MGKHRREAPQGCAVSRLALGFFLLLVLGAGVVVGTRDLGGDASSVDSAAPATRSADPSVTSTAIEIPTTVAASQSLVTPSVAIVAGDDMHANTRTPLRHAEAPAIVPAVTPTTNTTPEAYTSPLDQASPQSSGDGCGGTATECFSELGLTFTNEELSNSDPNAIPDCLIFHTLTELYEWVEGPCTAQIVP